MAAQAAGAGPARGSGAGPQQAAQPAPHPSPQPVSPFDTGGVVVRELGPFAVGGVVLPALRVAYRHDGPGPAEAPQVLVIHALTGSADAAGDWWAPLIGPGRALDTTRVGVLCANLLGGCYGTTGPTTVDASPIPSERRRSRPRAFEPAGSLGRRSGKTACRSGDSSR